MASFYDTDVANRYQRIYNKCSNNYIIEQLYDTDKLLFDPNFIDTIIKIGEKNEYNIQDFAELSTILISTFFKSYITTTDHNLLTQFHHYCDEYFKAICYDLNKQHMSIKNKILTLLRLKLTVPSIQSNLSFHNPTVSISSNYRPKEQELATAGCDIKNILQNNYFKSVKDCPSITYSYNSHPGSIQLQGPILNKLATYTLILQQEIMRHANACGVKTKPFIRNTINLGLGLGDSMMGDTSSGVLVPTMGGDSY